VRLLRRPSKLQRPRAAASFARPPTVLLLPAGGACRLDHSGAPSHADAARPPLCPSRPQRSPSRTTPAGGSAVAGQPDEVAGPRSSVPGASSRSRGARLPRRLSMPRRSRTDGPLARRSQVLRLLVAAVCKLDPSDAPFRAHGARLQLLPSKPQISPSTARPVGTSAVIGQLDEVARLRSSAAGLSSRVRGALLLQRPSMLQRSRAAVPFACRSELRLLFAVSACWLDQSSEQSHAHDARLQLRPSKPQRSASTARLVGTSAVACQRDLIALPRSSATALSSRARGVQPLRNPSKL